MKKDQPANTTKSKNMQNVTGKIQEHNDSLTESGNMTLMVFILEHSYEDQCGCEQTKRIGIYSSRDNAFNAKRRLADKIGFSDYPDGFHVDEVTLDHDNWVEGFVTVKYGEV